MEAFQWQEWFQKTHGFYRGKFYPWAEVAASDHTFRCLDTHLGPRKKLWKLLGGSGTKSSSAGAKAAAGSVEKRRKTCSAGLELTFCLRSRNFDRSGKPIFGRRLRSSLDSGDARSGSLSRLQHA